MTNEKTPGKRGFPCPETEEGKQYDNEEKAPHRCPATGICTRQLYSGGSIRRIRRCILNAGHTADHLFPPPWKERPPNPASSPGGIPARLKEITP